MELTRAKLVYSDSMEKEENADSVIQSKRKQSKAMTRLKHRTKSQQIDSENKQQPRLSDSADELTQLTLDSDKTRKQSTEIDSIISL